MGFGTQQQLGNRTGVTNQTSLADLFGGVGNSPQPPTAPGGGNISQPGLGQPGFGQGGMDGNQLFTLLQSLLGGQGGFQSPGGQTGQAPIGTPIPGAKPGIGLAPPPGKDFGGGQITPIGLGQQPNGFGGTPLTQLSNPFGNLINQRAIR